MYWKYLIVLVVPFVFLYGFIKIVFKFIDYSSEAFAHSRNEEENEQNKPKDTEMYLGNLRDRRHAKRTMLNMTAKQLRSVYSANPEKWKLYPGHYPFYKGEPVFVPYKDYLLLLGWIEEEFLKTHLPTISLDDLKEDISNGGDWGISEEGPSFVYNYDEDAPRLSGQKIPGILSTVDMPYRIIPRGEPLVECSSIMKPASHARMQYYYFPRADRKEMLDRIKASLRAKDLAKENEERIKNLKKNLQLANDMQEDVDKAAVDSYRNLSDAYIAVADTAAKVRDHIQQGQDNYLQDNRSYEVGVDIPAGVYQLTPRTRRQNMPGEYVVTKPDGIKYRSIEFMYPVTLSLSNGKKIDLFNCTAKLVSLSDVQRPKSYNQQNEEPIELKFHTANKEHV